MYPNTPNGFIEYLCDFIDQYNAMTALWHGYVNDPVDLDREECFV
jgi:hypothetical protein